MKYVDEFRDPAKAERLARAIRRLVTRPWNIMEVCGGQTHSIMRFGLDRLLPGGVELIHGPGCPVCVTPVEMIDRAIELAGQPQVILSSFGDMLRVPGSKEDLLSAKARGADVRIVYSPLDALKIASAHPARQVVFFAVGFETTAPANAMAVHQAHRLGVGNFSMLVSHVLVPPAIERILASAESRVHGFLAAGHVCTVMGYREYQPLAERYRVPIVVTGFEPVDLLEGIYLCLGQLERGEHFVENSYARSVREGGNPKAMQLIREVFEVSPRNWRGMGEIPSSGFRLRARYRNFDAELRFPSEAGSVAACPELRCISGLVLQGLKKPWECTEFGKRCTPDTPLGATMVSSEGACAAYYQYRREGNQE